MDPQSYYGGEFSANQNTQQKPSKRRLVIIVLVVLIVLAVATGVVSSLTKKSDSELEAQSFVKLLIDGKGSETYAMLTPSAQASELPAVWNQKVKDIGDGLDGNPKRTKQEDVTPKSSAKTKNGEGQTYRYTYDLTVGKSKYSIEILVEKLATAWRIVRFDSEPKQ